MKMKAKSILLLGAFVCSFGIMSCSTENVTPESTPTTNGGGGGGNNGGGTNLRPQKGLLEGFVHDSKGNALENVTVTSGTSTTQTDQNGFFALTQVALNGQRVIVKFTCSDYQPVVRSGAFQTGETWDVVMTSKYNYSGSVPSKTEYNIESTQDRAITVNSNAASTTKTMEVELKGNGYKDVETGTAFTGKVTASVSYLDPDAEDFADQMPGGDLAAVRTDGQEVQLVSYGMTAVSLTDSDGKPLQLTGDKPAELTFPVPENVKNMRAEDRPATIPLWSFDETKGVWVEEGVASYDSNRDVYVGSVKHFSWVNLDYPEVRATIKGVVKDENGTILPKIKLHIGQTSAITNDKGEFSVFVPKDTKVEVTVRAKDYGNYCDSEDQQAKVVVDGLAAGEEKEITLTLPTLAKITGNIVNQGNGGNIATVWLEYNRDSRKVETKKIRSDENGNFTLSAPTNYKGEIVVMVCTAEGQTIAKPLTYDGKDLSAGTITIKSNATNKGELTIAVDGGKTYTVKISNVGPYDIAGVTITDGSLYCDLGTERNYDETGVALHGSGISISGYSSSKTNYEIEGLEFWLMDFSNQGDKQGENQLQFEKITVNVQRSGNTMLFTIPLSEGVLLQRSWSEEGEDTKETDVTISGSFSMDILYEATKAKDVTSNDSRIPSFVKSLMPGDAPFAFFITQSEKLGKGCNLAFNADRETFDFIRTEAGKVMKEYTDYSYDGGNWSQVATFYENGKYLRLSWNYKDQYSSSYVEEPWQFWSTYSALNIQALEGNDLYITDIQSNTWGWAKKNDPTIWDK